MNNYKFIKVEKGEGRLDIILNSPPLNILTIAMMKEIITAVKEASKDQNLKVLVFRAEGKHFSAGADVAEHTADRVKEMIGVFSEMFQSISEVRGVTIAVVDGSALGGGCELATFCDMVLASERAKFGQPEILLGVLPPVAAVVFPRLIGRNKAMELILSGKIISANEAEKIGLVNHIFPVEDFSVKVDEFVRGFTNLSASSIAITRKLIDRTLKLPIKEGLKLADETYLDELMKTEDANEGLKAFLEKRKPVWKDK
jgi:cyclohexa-1,5-dienecarbonyl-CoA hydratase